MKTYYFEFTLNRHSRNPQLDRCRSHSAQIEARGLQMAIRHLVYEYESDTCFLSEVSVGIRENAMHRIHGLTT